MWKGCGTIGLVMLDDVQGLHLRRELVKVVS